MSSMPNPSKKRKIVPEDTNEKKISLSLLTLNPDALQFILTRTSAEDHDNLRATCTSLRDVLNSEEFRVARALSGWSESHTTLLTPMEMCRKENPSETEDLTDNEIMTSEDFNFAEDYYDMGSLDVNDIGYNEVNAKIWVDGKLGGSAKVILIFRSPDTDNFHEICDSISTDVQEVGVQFCDNNGFPRIGCIKETGTDAATGGFVYIEKLELHKEYRQATKIAAEAIRSLLCDTKLSGRWSLAAYIADECAHFTAEDRSKHQILIYGRGSEQREEIDKKKWKERLNILAKRDMRLFLRGGFQQVKELVTSTDCYHLFAVPSFLEGDIMSHEEALSIHIAQKPVFLDSPSGVNAKLLQLFVDACSEREMRTLPETDALKLRTRTEELIEAGATVEKSHALHCCAFNLLLEYITLLLDFVPEASKMVAINGLNHLGLTPLICAVRSFENGAEKSFSVCNTLVNLGADRSLTDPSGKTALGCLRKRVRNTKDFINTFSIEISQEDRQSKESMNTKFETLLNVGATNADNALIDTE